MNTGQLSFGQRVDEINGLVESWFTHGALDWIKQQDWSDKIVWMFGAGQGDIWLSKRCKELHVVERNEEWFAKCYARKAYNKADNLFYYHRPCNDCSGADEYYLGEITQCDVLINDDAYRYEVIESALTLKRPLILITDNWQQSYVFMCPAAEELLKDYESLIFEQADHTDNDGVNKWKTAIHFIK